MRRALLVALAALTLLAGCGETKKDQPDRLPDISLEGLGGHPAVDLGSFRGPAVVNLWASWCDPCKRELPIYAQFAKKYAGEVGVLGVDSQDLKVNNALALAEQSGVDYPLVADPDGRIRAFALPKLILVDAKGEITYDEYIEIKTLAQLEKLVAEHLPEAS